MKYKSIAQQLGSRGGKKTKLKYGNDYYSKLGKLSAEKRKKQKEAVDRISESAKISQNLSV